MTDRELMQRALDALDIFYDEYGWGEKQQKAHEALRARLAQPEPEPVAWHEPEAYGNVTVYEKWANENGWLPLYATPPQREWQGLTDEEIHGTDGYEEDRKMYRFARAIEAKLKEKST